MFTYSVESVVDEMLQVFTHSDLSHQLVLVAVHSCQLTHMGKDVLQSISQLQYRGEILGLVCVNILQNTKLTQYKKQITFLRATKTS